MTWIFLISFKLPVFQVGICFRDLLIDLFIDLFIIHLICFDVGFEKLYLNYRVPYRLLLCSDPGAAFPVRWSSRCLGFRRPIKHFPPLLPRRCKCSSWVSPCDHFIETLVFEIIEWWVKSILVSWASTCVAVSYHLWFSENRQTFNWGIWGTSPPLLGLNRVLGMIDTGHVFVQIVLKTWCVGCLHCIYASKYLLVRVNRVFKSILVVQTSHLFGSSVDG